MVIYAEYIQENNNTTKRNFKTAKSTRKNISSLKWTMKKRLYNKIRKIKNKNNPKHLLKNINKLRRM